MYVFVFYFKHIFLFPTLIPLSGIGTTYFSSCCDKDSANIFTDANDCKLSRDQQLNVPSEARNFLNLFPKHTEHIYTPWRRYVLSDYYSDISEYTCQSKPVEASNVIHLAWKVPCIKPAKAISLMPNILEYLQYMRLYSKPLHTALRSVHTIDIYL
jgi:hypothetical protein